MKRKFRKTEVLLFVAFMGWAIYVAINSLRNKTDYPTTTSVMPLPAEIWQHTGAFLINQETQIYADEHFWQEASLLQEELELETGIKFILNKAADPGVELQNAIVLQKSEKYGGKKFKDEGYRLEVFSGIIEIQASSAAGAFYAGESLVQLYSKDPEVLEIPTDYWKDGRTTFGFPCIKILDEPAYPWRGMLLDCSRHFMEVDFVKRYIDLLAKHKMNVLHWHLTEDQGWRIAIDAYPKLTEVGAWRDDGKGGQYGGFYTKDQIREIVTYASERHVTIVPEIEMPGHSQAALAAYPEFSCTGGPFKVETEWGVFREIYCAGRDGTFEFLETVFDEVIELFPSDYIHIGGDEVPKFRWENCRHCQRRMAEEGLETEEELQSWFINKMAKYAAQHRKTLIGWDEILDGPISENMIVQAWRGDGIEHGREAIERGHRLIMSPTSHAYFDYDLDAIDLEKVYSFNPSAVLEDDTSAKLLGGECNLWSERAPQRKVDSKVFPRLLAMSEILWSGHGQRSYDEFHAAVQQHYPRLQSWGVDYGPETVPVTFLTQISNNKSGKGGMQLALVPGSTNYDLRYRIASAAATGNFREVVVSEEKLPKEKSSMISYQNPIPIDSDFSIEVQAFAQEKPLGPVETRAFRAHMVLAQQVSLKREPTGSYIGSRKPPAANLTDGAKGTLKFRDGNWLGFYHAEDFEALVDLKTASEVNELRTGFYQYNNSWIFLPEEVRYYGGDDPATDSLKLIGIVKNDIAPTQRGQFTKDFALILKRPQKFRYIRVVAKSIGKVPEWHEAAGSDSWLFVDEIEVR